MARRQRLLPLVVAAQRRLTPLPLVAAVPRKTMLPLLQVVAAQRRLKAQRRSLAAVAKRQRKRNNYLRVKS